VAKPLAVGVLAELFTALSAEAVVKSMLALEPVAREVEREAKKNASNGSHTRRTPTPARPGQGPAQISGTLVRSITHSTPSPTIGGGWEIRIGPTGGMFAPYNSRTPSSKYGLYLETGLRNGAKYPFLLPAFHKVAEISVHTLFAEVFNSGWGISL
jgi:hypothetical protein